MTFRVTKLGEIATMKYGKMPPRDLLCEDGFPVFSGYRVTGFCKEYLYSEPQLVVVARGVGGTGDVKISPPKSWITNLSIVLGLDESRVCKNYLLYMLGLEPLKDKLNTGAAQAQITIESLKSYPISIPDIKTQEKVVRVLSAFDDLIENNHRRIQLLEQSARLLYKEWFVRLRFPGHERVKIKDRVPEGWEKKLLGEIAPLRYGKGLKEDDRIPGPFPVYGSSGIVGTHHKALVAGPVIIVGRKGNAGSVFMSNDDCYPIDTVYFIEGSMHTLFLYYALLHTSFISTDVAVPGLNRDYAHSRKFLMPNSKILNLFEDFMSPLHKEIYVLQKHSHTLAQARDLLLPRLMNGEIAL